MFILQIANDGKADVYECIWKKRVNVNVNVNGRKTQLVLRPGKRNLTFDLFYREYIFVHRIPLRI